MDKFFSHYNRWVLAAIVVVLMLLVLRLQIDGHNPPPPPTPAAAVHVHLGAEAIRGDQKQAEHKQAAIPAGEARDEAIRAATTATNAALREQMALQSNLQQIFGGR